jgi:hypothetical protein
VGFECNRLFSTTDNVAGRCGGTKSAKHPPGSLNYGPEYVLFDLFLAPEEGDTYESAIILAQAKLN